MRIKLEGTDFTISLWDLIQELSVEQKRGLAEHLVWDDDIFTDLVERLAIDRVVTESFSGNIHKARLRLLELLPEMHRNVVRSLLWEKTQSQEKQRRMSRWAWAMYHAWPKSYPDQRPQLEDYQDTPMPTDQVVEQEIKRRHDGDYNHEHHDLR